MLVALPVRHAGDIRIIGFVAWRMCYAGIDADPSWSEAVAGGAWGIDQLAAASGCSKGMATAVNSTSPSKSIAARVDLVGLAFGQKVLSLHYDGKTLRSWRHPMWPAQLRDEDVLENLQLTLWPVDAIRQALPAGWSIEESDLRRTILQNGLAIMVIDYSALPPWSGKVEVANLQFDYRITIQSVPNGALK